MPVNQNAAVCHGEREPVREQTNRVNGVPESERDDEQEWKTGVSMEKKYQTPRKSTFTVMENAFLKAQL